jgi:hypothetical protein
VLLCAASVLSVARLCAAYVFLGFVNFVVVAGEMGVKLAYYYGIPRWIHSFIMCLLMLCYVLAYNTFSSLLCVFTNCAFRIILSKRDFKRFSIQNNRVKRFKFKFKLKACKPRANTEATDGCVPPDSSKTTTDCYVPSASAKTTKATMVASVFTLCCISVSRVLNVNVERSQFVVDSGATHHVTGDMSLVASLCKDESFVLQVADRKLPERAVKCVFKENDLGLREGLFHKDMKATLISVPELEKSGYGVKFPPAGANEKREIYDGKGFSREITRENGLYLVKVDFGPDSAKTPSENTLDPKDPLLCVAIANAMKGSNETKLEFHRKMGHCHVPGFSLGKIVCPDCAIAKGGSRGHKKERTDENRPTKPMQKVDWDHTGPFPASWWSKKWLLLGICQFSKWEEAFPSVHKSDAGDKLNSFCENIAVPDYVRSDNDPTFKGVNSMWKRICAKWKILPEHSSPYCPQQNSVVERANRTNADAIRTNLVGVDKRVWDYAAVFVSWVRNRLPRRSLGGMSPFEKRTGRKPSTGYFKRFGCLCYAKNQIKTELGKLDDRYHRGIFLGYARNSSYLVGMWVEHKGARSGWRFKVVENRKCRFDEDVLISDIEHLREDSLGTYVPFSLPESLGDDEFDQGFDVVPDGGHDLSSGARQDGEDSRSGDTSEAEENVVLEPPAKRRKVQNSGKDPLELSEELGVPPEDYGAELSDDLCDRGAGSKQTVLGDKTVSRSQTPTASQQVETELDDAQGKSSASGGARGGSRRPTPLVSGDGSQAQQSVFEENGCLKKRRGRKPGTKALPHWKKPGPKAKKKSRKAARATLCGLGDSLLSGKASEADKFEFSAEESQKQAAAIREDGEALTFTVQITRKEAYTGPDAVKWIEAADKEVLQLETLKCWRPVQPGELLPGDEVIPSVLVFTRKRCGKFKARLVALGNKQSIECSGEIYAPTVSHPGNRWLITHAASEGMYIDQFDISNAFISAELGDEKVIVRLPPEYSSDPKGDLVRLLKSLYGLRIAPRRWYDCYRKHLEKIGWKPSDREPGIFTKTVNNQPVWLSIYVDDSFLACKSEKIMLAERDRILCDDGFPGKVIPPDFAPEDVRKETEIRDVLGATLHYNRKARTMSFIMDGAIDRMLKKFNLGDVRSVATPCIHEADLAGGEKNTAFPLRSLVGSLLYISMIARPDISFAVQRVARFCSEPTDAAVQAAKRIARYLKGTRKLGVSYSPGKERRFRETYTKVASEQDKKLEDFVAFTDSDFAGDTVSLKSTTGSILYYKGTPVCWSARRQGIRALSTCEAEYVAAFDTIQMVRGQGYLDYFLEADDIPLLFCDNQSTIALSKSSIVTKKSKHMQLRFHTVKDHFKSLCYCPSLLNRADPLTKPLTSDRYIDVFFLSAQFQDIVVSDSKVFTACVAQDCVVASGADDGDFDDYSGCAIRP